MSHEVRTPLNAIVGFSGLMATATSEEEKKMYTDIISENNERLLRLVNDIFDLSQIDAGVLNFVYSEFDANDLLRELEGVFGMKLNENPLVALICEAHLEPIMMHSEKQRIIQVLTNLLHNAMKFTKTGKSVLDVVWRVQMKSVFMSLILALVFRKRSRRRYSPTLRNLTGRCREQDSD